MALQDNKKEIHNYCDYEEVKKSFLEFQEEYWETCDLGGGFQGNWDLLVEKHFGNDFLEEDID